MSENQIDNASAVDVNNHFYVHGLSRTPEYLIWRGIKNRTHRPSGQDKITYAGVKMYEPWINDPVAFIKYIGPRPSEKHSIDRWPNRNGNYEPGNIRWATWTEQNRNKDDLRWFEVGGEILCVGQIAERFNIPYMVIYARLVLNGWSIERATTEPVLKHPKIEYQGKQYSMRGICREHACVDYNTFRYRIRTGMTLEEALKTPTHSFKRSLGA